MTRILFVCHGNICRSPMAQFVMQKYVDDAGLSGQFVIDSKATSTEELGNPPYPPAVAKLRREGIPMKAHHASQIVKSDYERYDYIIGMDTNNMRNISHVWPQDPEHKIFKLLDFTSRGGDIADPWYSGDFDATYDDITEGCSALLKSIQH